MFMKSKYRVKVVIDNRLGIHYPETKYVIQSRTIFGWVNEHDPTGKKDWAYQTCEEMNTEYEEIRAKNKSKTM